MDLPSYDSLNSLKRSRAVFSSPSFPPPVPQKITRLLVTAKVASRYPAVSVSEQQSNKSNNGENNSTKAALDTIIDTKSQQQTSNALVSVSRGEEGRPENASLLPGQRNVDKKEETASKTAIVKRTAQALEIPTPKWHAPWKLKSVISGHLGWVRSIAFDPANEYFVTGSADRTIKVWDFAKASVASQDALKLTLTGHINAVRGLAISDRHPYLFSCGEDKMVKCWDLEYNKCIRQYHGHLSGVFSLKLHPTIDVLMTGGRDAVCRVWDIRTKEQIHCLGGHEGTVASILTNNVDPQVITGSHDAKIKLWDLAAGKVMTTLTHHKKSVRAMASHPREFSFVSGSTNSLKKWQTSDGRFIQNFNGHNGVVNSMCCNDDGVLVSCGDDGSMRFWDYQTGYNFQKAETIVQPGSLEAERGIFASEFDITGTRLITCEADKTIKVWMEDGEASEVSHPVDLPGWRKECIREARQRY